MSSSLSRSTGVCVLGGLLYGVHSSDLRRLLHRCADGGDVLLHTCYFISFTSADGLKMKQHLSADEAMSSLFILLFTMNPFIHWFILIPKAGGEPSATQA